MTPFAAAIFLLCLAAFGFDSTLSYSFFVSKIPNGNRIPNPCSPGGSWPGVGHVKPEGGKYSLTQFGSDFSSNGNSWNKAFCQMDSDGDGKTNGEELGDPNCQWTEGSTTTAGLTITNPAVCEPIGSSACARNNGFLSGMACNPVTQPPSPTQKSSPTGGNQASSSPAGADRTSPNPPNPTSPNPPNPAGSTPSSTEGTSVETSDGDENENESKPTQPSSGGQDTSQSAPSGSSQPGQNAATTQPMTQAPGATTARSSAPGFGHSQLLFVPYVAAAWSLAVCLF